MNQFEFHGWALIDGAERITKEPSSRIILGKTILFFRDSHNRLQGFDSRCPHMNADLTKAQIQNDHIVCPFHAWKFSTEGHCVSIPGEARCFKEKVNLKKYRVIEKFDLAFISFLETAVPDSLIEEPEFFVDRDFKDYQRSVVHRFEVNTDWHLAAANSFDLAHFVFVHNRKLTEPPVAKAVSNFTYMIDLHYEILAGGNWIDKIIRWTRGPFARLRYFVSMGNYIRAEVQFGKKTSQSTNLMLILTEPSSKGKCIAKLVVFVKKDPWARLRAKFQAQLSKIFFTQEVSLLNGVRINWDHLTTSDSAIINYYSWLQKSLQLIEFRQKALFEKSNSEKGPIENELRF